MLDGLIPEGFGEDRSSGRPYSFRMRESSCSKRACEGMAMEVAVAVAPESVILRARASLCLGFAEAAHIESWKEGVDFFLGVQKPL
jgi:hypothetical protein